MKSGKFSGFTLVEVMAAVSIFTVTSAAVLLSVNASLGAHQLSEQYIEASGYMRSLHSMLRGGAISPDGETEGEFSGTPFEWSAEFSSSGIEQDLYKVEFEINWQHHSKPRSLSTTTLYLLE